MADGTTILNAITGPAASNAYDTSGASDIRVQVYAGSAATGTVIIQASEKAAGPWATVLSITNPDTTGVIQTVPRSSWVRVQATALSAGNVSAVLSAWQGNRRIY